MVLSALKEQLQRATWSDDRGRKNDADGIEFPNYFAYDESHMKCGQEVRKVWRMTCNKRCLWHGTMLSMGPITDQILGEGHKGSSH